MRGVLLSPLVFAAILLTMISGASNVSALVCDVPTMYPDVDAALTAGCTTIIFVSDVVEDTGLSYSTTGGQLLINGNGYRWIHTSSNPYISISSAPDLLEVVIRDISIELTGGTPLNWFFTATGNVDVEMYMVEMSTSLTNIFTGFTYIAPNLGSGHVYNFTNVSFNAPLAASVSIGLNVWSMSDISLYRAVNITSQGVDSPVYLFSSSGQVRDVYVENVSSDGRVSITIYNAFSPINIYVNNLFGYYTDFFPPVMNMLIVRGDPIFQISNVIATDMRYGGVSFACLSCIVNGEISNVWVDSQNTYGWGVTVFSYGSPAYPKKEMTLTIRNVYTRYPTISFGGGIALLTGFSNNTIAIENLDCAMCNTGIYSESTLNSNNTIMISDSRVNARSFGIEVIADFSSNVSVIVNGLDTSASFGWDGSFEVNRYTASDTANISIYAYRWMVSDDPASDIRFLTSVTSVPNNYPIWGEFVYSKVDTVELEDYTYINFTETVVIEHSSLFATNSLSYSRWTLAVEVVSSIMGTPVPFVPVDYYLDGVKLATVQTSLSGVAEYTFFYRLGDDPVPELHRIAVSAPGLPVLSLHYDLGVDGSLPSWYGRVTLEVEAIGLVANGFSQEIGAARLIIGGEKAVLYGYYHEIPISPSSSIPSIKIEIIIKGIAASPYYVVIRGLMETGEGYIETIIYVNIIDRRVWIPGPISFIGGF